MKIVITQEDVKNNPNYDSPSNCPMAKALQKALNDDSILFCWSKVSNKDDFYIGRIDPQFTLTEFEDLENGEITEFVTEYTPNT